MTNPKSTIQNPQSMDHLSKLLSIDNSNLAWVLRLGLHGLRTQLHQALKTATTDPGSSACQKLLRELDAILESTSVLEPSEDSSLWEDVLEPAGDELNLLQVGEAMQGDRELFNYIGQYQFISTNDAELWHEMQRLLLRVPEKMAHDWQERILTEVSKLGAVEDQQTYFSLPFTRDESVYFGLTGKVQATGLRLSDQVVDPQLMVETRGEELDFLAGVVAICLKFIELDSCLHHALKSIDRFGVRSLNLESEKSKYVTALIDRFHRVQATTVDADPVVALRARLDLDEAIHSLVYLPPCDRYSWWGKLQLEARRTLDTAVEKARHAGYQIQIRPLWGTYADIFTWSKDDLQLDIGGVRGEVSACLRVYAKINDEVLPGRVIFRSS